MNEGVNVLGVVFGVLQAICVLVLTAVWSEIKSAKKEFREDLKQQKEEIYRELKTLRDRYHELKPTKDSLDNFTRVVEDLLLLVRDRK